MIKRCLCSSVLHTGNAKHTFICSLCLDPDAFAENRIGDIWWCHSVMEKICTWSQTGGGLSPLLVTHEGGQATQTLGTLVFSL